MVVDRDNGRSLLERTQGRALEGRRGLAAIVDDLFGERQAVLSEREHAVMTDILAKLLREVETALRRDLAESYSQGQTAAPHDLVLALANHEVEFARPRLLASGVLEDPALVEAIHHRTLEHQLATALRAQAGEMVSAALAESRNDDVMRALLESPDAGVAEAASAYLVEEARRVDSYQEPLVRCRDLDPGLTRGLCLRVAAAVRRHLLEDFEVEAVDLDERLEGVALALAARKESEMAGPDPATTLAERLAGRETITAALLLRALRQGEVALFEALFGRLAGLGPPQLQRTVYGPDGQDLAIACRALDVARDDFGRLFGLLRQARPNHQAAAAAADGLEQFDRIGEAAARDVLRYWRRDPGYIDAVEDIAQGREEDTGGA